MLLSTFSTSIQRQVRSQYCVTPMKFKFHAPLSMLSTLSSTAAASTLTPSASSVAVVFGSGAARFVNTSSHNGTRTIRTSPESATHLNHASVSALSHAVSNLLYDVPHRSTATQRRTLCALVSNEPGVLSRVSGCLAGRGFNIDSLVVSETETPGLSRMTIVLVGGKDIEQARRQLEDLVQVWACVEFTAEQPVVERELLLIKLNVQPTHSTIPGMELGPMSSHIQRQAIVELTSLFQGRVVDVTNEHVMVELTAKANRIQAFIQLVKPFGIKELARSGTLAMLRGRMSGLECSHEEGGGGAGTGAGAGADEHQVDETQLPPG